MKVLNRLNEGDIDKRLVEWLRGSGTFRDGFLHLAGYAGWTLDKVMNSTWSDGRECDVRLELSREGVMAVLLIENKIRAPFGPNQVGAYSRMRETEIDAGRLATTCLMSPGSYPSRHPGAAIFDIRISYEDVRDVIRSTDLHGSSFVADLFQQAIDKCPPARTKADMRIPLRSNARHLREHDRSFLEGVSIDNQPLQGPGPHPLLSLLRYAHDQLVLASIDRVLLSGQGYIDDAAQLTDRGQHMLEIVVGWARDTGFAIPAPPVIVDGCGYTDDQRVHAAYLKARKHSRQHGGPILPSLKTSSRRIPTLDEVKRQLGESRRVRSAQS
jgi:hypothetical protein